MLLTIDIVVGEDGSRQATNRMWVFIIFYIFDPTLRRAAFLAEALFPISNKWGRLRKKTLNGKKTNIHRMLSIQHPKTDLLHQPT